MFLVFALLLGQGASFAQTTGRVAIEAPFKWPRSGESISGGQPAFKRRYRDIRERCEGTDSRNKGTSDPCR